MVVHDATDGGVPVLRVTGPLDPHGFRTLQELAQRHVARRCRRLVVELRDVPNLDGLALTRLLAVLTHAVPDALIARGTNIGCDDLSRPTRLVLEVTHVERRQQPRGGDVPVRPNRPLLGA